MSELYVPEGIIHHTPDQIKEEHRPGVDELVYSLYVGMRRGLRPIREFGDPVDKQGFTERTAISSYAFAFANYAQAETKLKDLGFFQFDRLYECIGVETIKKAFDKRTGILYKQVGEHADQLAAFDKYFLDPEVLSE